MESDNQKDSTLGDESLNLKPWLWKKGQSGNLAGRPKGVTLKEYAKDFLARMTDEERDAFMDGLNKETIWKMAEGNPETKTDLTSGGQAFIIKTIEYGHPDTTQSQQHE